MYPKYLRGENLATNIGKNDKKYLPSLVQKELDLLAEGKTWNSQSNFCRNRTFEFGSFTGSENFSFRLENWR